MTAIADTGPGQLIRWPYLGYAVLALGVMTVAIASHDHWFLNFVHVICGVLWTGIDLFMGRSYARSVCPCAVKSSSDWCRGRSS
jgi:hypothetical protein